MKIRVTHIVEGQEYKHTFTHGLIMMCCRGSLKCSDCFQATHHMNANISCDNANAKSDVMPNECQGEKLTFR